MKELWFGRVPERVSWSGLDAVQGLVDLTIFGCRGFGLLDAPATLGRLRRLWVVGTEVDLSGIEAAAKLEDFNVVGSTRPVDLEVPALRRLKRLHIEASEVASLAPLQGMTALRHLGFSAFRPVKLADFRLPRSLELLQLSLFWEVDDWKWLKDSNVRELWVYGDAGFRPEIVLRSLPASLLTLTVFHRKAPLDLTPLADHPSLREVRLYGPAPTLPPHRRWKFVHSVS